MDEAQVLICRVVLQLGNIFERSSSVLLDISSRKVYLYQVALIDEEIRNSSNKPRDNLD